MSVPLGGLCEPFTDDTPHLRFLSTGQVVRDSSHHQVHEYTMTIRIWCPEYSIHYTDGDNSKLIATDTIRNTVRARQD